MGANTSAGSSTRTPISTRFEVELTAAYLVAGRLAHGGFGCRFRGLDEHLQGVRLAVIVTALGGGTGGGGTLETAKYLGNHGIPVLDIGVPVLSMHSPFEVIHKSDLYMAYRAFSLFNNAQ